MKQELQYVLWLPSWYPSKLKPYNGDFIQRQAFATSAYQLIELIHVIRDEGGHVTKTVKKEVKVSNNLREVTVYYYQRRMFFTMAERFLSHLKYIRIYKSEITELIKKKGLPSMVHVHIALKAGMLGLWIKRKYKINYILSEHWTVYLAEAKPGLRSLRMFRNTFQKIFKNASKLVVVSAYLGERLKNLFEIPSYILIPNVVDTKVFQFKEKVKNPLPVFIYISGLNYQKNPKDILDAFRLLKEKGYEFLLRIVGPKTDWIVEHASRLGLKSNIHFLDEMPQNELAVYLQQSDALVLYSNYETFGCVLIEAFACRVPLIVSDIPVMHENVQLEVNGIIVKSENPAALASSFIQFIEEPWKFNQQEIAKSVEERYGYKKIGNDISKLYNG
ncbi:MAG: glycosyltransferase [Flavisolibacter sp.]|nr:glycosyltransferase [Flavisolibacter sp.]